MVNANYSEFSILQIFLKMKKKTLFKYSYAQSGRDNIR